MILVLGDPHIGGGGNLGKLIPGQPINTRVKDQFDILDWVLDISIENNAEAIAITGDLFDNPKPSHILINLIINWCKKAVSNGKKIFIIGGNHDIDFKSGSEYYSALDILSHIDGVYVYKDISIVDFDSIKTSVLFYPFKDRKSYRADTTNAALKIVKNTLDDSLENMKYSNKIVISHFALEGSVYYDEVSDITNELMIPLRFFNGFSHSISGHIHSPQNFGNIDIIGSMDISNFGETDQRKRVMLISENSIKSIEIPTRKLNKVKVDIPSDVEDTTQYLLDVLKSNRELNNSITKIEVNIENSLAKIIDRKRIESYLTEQGVHSLVGLSETRTKEIKKKETLMSFDISLSSAIKKYSDRFENESVKNRFIEVAFGLVDKISEKSS